MTKRLLILLTAGIVLSLTFTAGVFASTKGIHIFINGQKIGLSGENINGQVMVSLDELTKALGGTLQLHPENNTASVTLPGLNLAEGSDLGESYTIQITKIIEGVSILTITGEVTNISDSTLTSLTAYGKLMDSAGRDLTRTSTFHIQPAELVPGGKGSFEVMFMDYYKFKDNNSKYGIYIQGFSY